MASSQVQQDIISILKKAERILVLPSSPIDGDCLGSALALYLVLKKMGKEVTVVAEEKIPETYDFLPEISIISSDLHFVRDFVVTIDCRDNKPKNVRHEIQGNKINIIVTPEKGAITREQISFGEGAPQFDCIITVDAADISQLGKIYENFTELFHLVPVINIDHHASNNSFGKFNLIDIMAPSTTTLILPLIEELGQTVDADIATLLLVGLITDTGSFQNPNTTPDAFSIAAKLIGYGARQQEIIRNIYKTKKLSTLRLWGRTLTKIQNDEKHKLVWSVLTAQDFAELGGSPDETEGVIDELMSNAPDAEIIFLLKEKGPLEMSGSIRTLTSSIDASKLAELFGGGGHTQAAGFKIKGKNIIEAEKFIVEGLKDFQKKRLRIFEAEAVTASTPVAAPIAPALAPAPAAAQTPEVFPQAPILTQTQASAPTPAPARQFQIQNIMPAPAPIPPPVPIQAPQEKSIPVLTQTEPSMPTWFSSTGFEAPTQTTAKPATTPAPEPNPIAPQQTPPTPQQPAQPQYIPNNSFPTPPGIIG